MYSINIPKTLYPGDGYGYAIVDTTNGKVKKCGLSKPARGGVVTVPPEETFVGEFKDGVLHVITDYDNALPLHENLCSPE